MSALLMGHADGVGAPGGGIEPLLTAVGVAGLSPSHGGPAASVAAGEGLGCDRPRCPLHGRVGASGSNASVPTAEKNH